MPLPSAILFCVSLLFGTAGISTALEAPALPALVIIATALWVYFDAEKLQLARYRTGLVSPRVATIGMFMMWIVVFPWYLSARHKIIRGEMPLKEQEPPA